MLEIGFASPSGSKRFRKRFAPAESGPGTEGSAGAVSLLLEDKPPSEERAANDSLQEADPITSRTLALESGAESLEHLKQEELEAKLSMSVSLSSNGV